jgi:hypothetical protein
MHNGKALPLLEGWVAFINLESLPICKAMEIKMCL